MRRSPRHQAHHLSLIALLALLSAGCNATLTPAPEHSFDAPLLRRDAPATARLRMLHAMGQVRAERAARAVASAARSAPAGRASRAPGSATGRAISSPERDARAPIPRAPTLSSQRISAPSAPARAARTDAHDVAYIAAMHARHNATLPDKALGDASALYKHCKAAKKVSFKAPRAGDVAFFHNTWDSNGDGRNNDWYTHAAMVQAIASDGSVTLLGYRDGQVRRFTMDLKRPDDHARNGALRAKRAQDVPFTQYLAAQLYAGSCGLMPSGAFSLEEHWRP